MSSLENRHISFVIEGQTYLIHTRASVDELNKIFPIRFTFNREAGPIDLNYVIVYKEFDEILMITERGNQFSSGPLYNQLYPWYMEFFEKSI